MTPMMMDRGTTSTRAKSAMLSVVPMPNMMIWIRGPMRLVTLPADEVLREEERGGHAGKDGHREGVAAQGAAPSDEPRGQQEASDQAASQDRVETSRDRVEIEHIHVRRV